MGSLVSFGSGGTLVSLEAGASGLVPLPDNSGITLGDDKDNVLYHRASTLGANTALSNVLEGTPVTPALAANSLIISNITDDGDILLAVSDGGNSKGLVHLDGSTGEIHVHSPDGFNMGNGSDADQDLLTVDVTGTPKLYWDESQNTFNFNKALWVNGGITTGGVIPLDYYENYIAGDFTSGGGSTLASKFVIGGTLTGVNGDTFDLTGTTFAPSITTQSNGETIGVVTTVRINEPSITKGTDTVTVASSLYIASAPDEGATNAALYIASGDAYLQTVTLNGTLVVDSNGGVIRSKNVDDNYAQLQARDNGAGVVEIARLQGAADPYFQATLPMVLNPSSAPGTPVEGHFYYDSTANKLKFYNGSSWETVTSS